MLFFDVLMKLAMHHPVLLYKTKKVKCNCCACCHGKQFMISKWRKNVLRDVEDKTKVVMDTEMTRCSMCG